MTGNDLARDISDFTPQGGELAFWWLGQMGFAVRVNGLLFYMDAYLGQSESRIYPPILEAKHLARSDFIFGSHDHGDHIDHALWKDVHALSKKTVFVAPKLVVPGLSKGLGIAEDGFIGMDEGVEFNNGAIRVNAIASAHEFLSADPETGLFPSLGYVIECGGFRIYHSGDTCKYEGLETKLRGMGEIDLMIVPINGRDGKKLRAGIIGNMDFREAVDLVGMVKPRVGVPAHYDMFRGNTEDPGEFIDYLREKYPRQGYWAGERNTRTVIRK